MRLQRKGSPAILIGAYKTGLHHWSATAGSKCWRRALRWLRWRCRFSGEAILVQSVYHSFQYRTADMNKSHLLLEKFDEIVRHTAVLIQPIEPEFIRFVQNQEACRKKWLSSELEAEQLRKDVSKLQADKSALEHQLKHSRQQIEKEMQKRHRAEEEAEKLGRQVALIKELLNDKNNKSYQQLLTSEDRERLAFLDASFQQRRSGGTGQDSDFLSKQYDKAFDSSASMLSDSDISYDKTMEDLSSSHLLRNGKRYSKRPSAPPLELLDSVDGDAPRGNGVSPKRQRTEGMPRDNAASQPQERSRRSRRMKRSISVGNPVETNPDDSFFGIDSDTPGQAPNAPEASFPQRSILKHTLADSASPTPSSDSSSAPMKRWASVSKLTRAHNFVCKPVLSPEMCIPCGKKIRFGKIAFKCKDCRIFCHQECQDHVPLPCIPTGGCTPTKGAGAVISDFAPLEAPFIPLLMVHCINEVENRGLTQVGIYRVPGAEKEVKDLKERFLKSRCGVTLANVTDINVVCGCLKDFLRGLREPLVPTAMWNQFTAAATQAQSGGATLLQDAVKDLPQANRDSLAFLVRHLQRVASHAECKMPLPNLAKVFGPTVVGYSNPDVEPMQMITETKKQQEVMEALLNLPCTFWESFLNNTGRPAGPRNLMEKTPSTPDCRPAPSYSSLLGAFTGARSAATPMANTPQDGAASAKHMKYGSGTKRSFFPSPMLK